MNQIAEIVRSSIVPDQSGKRFLGAARAADAFLRQQGGLLSPTLPKAEDGCGTDHAVRADLAAARMAASAVGDNPAAKALIAAIQPVSVEMRHEAVHWQSP